MIRFGESDTKLTVDIEPTVTNEEAYVVQRGGTVLGKVVAKYDFSHLPEQWHGLILQLVMKSNVIEVCF